MAAGAGESSSRLPDDARRALDRLAAARVVELGSGTGLVSIALAHICPAGGEITATDLGELGGVRGTADKADSAMEIMAENITLNGGGVTPAVLDWDAPVPEWVASDWPDVVVYVPPPHTTCKLSLTPQVPQT